jgi:hypothetical protein
MATGVAGGTEEVWNSKDLVRRCGVSIGAEHPQPQTLPWLLQRVGKITEPLMQRVGELDKWLDQYHGAFFKVDSGMISLTDEGATKFSSEARIFTAPPLDAAEASLASELRNTVFEELRLESNRRREAGGLYDGKKKASVASSEN